MVPKWVRVVTIAAVSVVAAVAAIVSYVHMRELADQAGEQWRAHIIPLSADGLLVAASMVMLVRRRAGERAGLLAWTGLLLGLAASLGANLAVADWTDPVSIAVSGWPPLALAVSFELLIMVTRRTETAPVQTVGELVRKTVPTTDMTGQETAVPVPVTTGPATGHAGTVPTSETAETGSDRGGHGGTVTDEAVLAWLRDRAEKDRKVPSRKAVIERWSIGATRADRLRGQVTVPVLRSVK